MRLDTRSGNCSPVRLAIFSASCGCIMLPVRFSSSSGREMPSNHIQQVNNVAARGFGHLLAFVVSNQTGHVDGMERVPPRFAVFIFDEVHGSS